VLDRKRNISFVFDAAGLTKIQLWFAEAASRADAMKATDELIAYLKESHGDLESPSLQAGTDVTTEALFAALERTAEGGPANVQLAPRKSPEGVLVFASIFRRPPYGHYVFLFPTRPRR
jgi:hypothetical protein